jgi:hypothetical protein
LVLKLLFNEIVRVWFFRQVKGGSWLTALAVAILACGLPLSADTLTVNHAVAPDRLFDPSLLSASVSSSEFPSIGADLLLRAEEPRELFGLAAFPSEADTLNLLVEQKDDRSESGAEGVRRFILLTILFGAVLRFLTSPAFYAWAADVFDPLDGY